MTTFIIIVVLLIAANAYGQLYNRLSSDVVGMGMFAILLLSGILSPAEAMSSFSAYTVMLVAVLFILVSAMAHSGVMQWIVKYLLGQPRNYKSALIRLMTPVALLSTILTNSVVVYTFVNVVKQWCKNLRIAPSRLLIPLSFASVMGGTCTMIGSAPNLIISEFYTYETGIEMELFSPFLPGICCAGIGILSVWLMHKLLPVRRSPEESFHNSSDYTMEFLVPSDCPHVGETVKEAGLQIVKGGHLIEIVRFDREVISPVPQDEFILGGDRLVYTGFVNNLLELRDHHGLVNATHHVFSVNEIDQNRQLQMVNINAESPLIGKRLCDSSFEDDNEVVLVAVAREGQRLMGLPREIVLHAGDTLLLEGRKLKPEHFTENLDFFDSVLLAHSGKRTIASSLIMLLMIVLAVFHIMPLLKSAMLAVMLMVICQCLSIKQIQDSINWKLLLVFSGSICLGKAIDIMGLDIEVAEDLVELCHSNSLTVLIVLCTFASFITEFISGTTAGAILAPVAINTAYLLEANPMTFVIGLMIAVSSSFACPLGSDTHTMVYGPGGYRYHDFVRIGTPLNIIMLIANIVFVTWFYPL